MGYLVETKAAVLPHFQVFVPVGGAMRVLPGHIMDVDVGVIPAVTSGVKMEIVAFN